MVEEKSYNEFIERFLRPSKKREIINRYDINRNEDLKRFISDLFMASREIDYTRVLPPEADNLPKEDKQKLMRVLLSASDHLSLFEQKDIKNLYELIKSGKWKRKEDKELESLFESTSMQNLLSALQGLAAQLGSPYLQGKNWEQENHFLKIVDKINEIFGLEGIPLEDQSGQKGKVANNESGIRFKFRDIENVIKELDPYIQKVTNPDITWEDMMRILSRMKVPVEVNFSYSPEDKVWSAIFTYEIAGRKWEIMVTGRGDLNAAIKTFSKYLSGII